MTENEALIESSFRRLLASIESEREKIRSTWVDIDNERNSAVTKLEDLRRETDEICHSERQKIELEWKRVDKLREKMSILWADQASENFEINCSGMHYSLPKSLLVTIEGSYLNHMFSDGFIANIPRDANGRFFLDFNPYCFGLILQYLQARADRADALPPPVPPEQQQNMDMLAEALKLKAFMASNRINLGHGTSLRVAGVAEGRAVIEASHPGWQVISAAYPLPMASTAYFEVHVKSNSEVKGGLAIGICGHIPQGPEIHSIRMKDSVMYNSVVGLVGDAFAAENVAKGILLAEGSCIGVRHDARTHTLEWFVNRSSIGSSLIRRESHEKLLQMYPVVALSAKGQKVEVNFVVASPFARADQGEDDD